MADPLSVAASLLGITTTAIQTIDSLYRTVRRYKARDKTLRRLQDELEDITKILNCLKGVVDIERPVLSLLRDPIQRCNQECRDFEMSMEVFSKKSTTGMRDWARMEFMRGDINEFINNVEVYKSTISVALGTITMHTSTVSNQVLAEYKEMIKDTTYNLDIRLQRIDEKLTWLANGRSEQQDICVDLTDEREVTKQCLRVCEDASSYLESLVKQASSLRPKKVSAGPEDLSPAQVCTSQALATSQERFAQTISFLSSRLDSLVRSGASEHDIEQKRLQADIDISKQCLDVCELASKVSPQKIYKVGEAIADGDSDQVIVTTLADLFDVGKALSKDNSAQLIASTTEESLKHLASLRYSSRFGTPTNDSTISAAGISEPAQTLNNRKSAQSYSSQVDSSPRDSNFGTRPVPPHSNEVRKRVPDDTVNP